MPLTGLFLVPLTPSSTSPVQALVSHISLNFPSTPLPAYAVASQLFVSTSSLLPDAQAQIGRQFCQLLSTSHHGGAIYVGVTAAAAAATTTDTKTTTETKMITIPASSADPFVQLLTGKLQPLWTHRQSLSVDNGTALRLHQGRFTLRIGELKQTSRLGGSPANARGVLIEITDQSGSISGQDQHRIENGQLGGDEDHTVLMAILERLIEGSGVALDLAQARLSARFTTEAEAEADAQQEAKLSGASWALAELYMDVLRGTRS